VIVMERYQPGGNLAPGNPGWFTRFAGGRLLLCFRYVQPFIKLVHAVYDILRTHISN